MFWLCLDSLGGRACVLHLLLAGPLIKLAFFVVKPTARAPPQTAGAEQAAGPQSPEGFASDR